MNILPTAGTTFELLEREAAICSDDISSPVDSFETCWPTTISKHRSTSTLLLKPSMPGVIINSLVNGDSSSDNGQNSPVPSSNPGAIQPVRRTTPIYQNYTQAYTSITGGSTGFRSDSQPGTDSLNNVYARAMRESATRSSRSLSSPSQLTSSYPIGGAVQLPFMRGETPEDDDNSDNPAGMAMQSNDVPLQPILRTVPRPAVIYSTSIPREPSPIAFREADLSGRDRALSSPLRAPTPYPGTTSSSMAIDPSVAAIIAQYGDADSNEELPTTPTPGRAAAGVRADQEGTPTVAGPAPAWPLPTEPSTLTGNADTHAAPLSSSPPTYGATMDLLNPRQRAASIYRPQILKLPEMARQRTTGRYSSEMDETLARCGRSTTPFNQIGEPGPAVESSPRSLSPAADVLPQSRTYAADAFDRSYEARDVIEDAAPSSSSAIGIAMSSDDDGVIRYQQPANITELLRSRRELDDDAAWETTQGSNTQRNSAVPDVDAEDYSSNESINRGPISTWDPLANRREEAIVETEREFAALVRAQNSSGLGKVQPGTPEHSIIASLQEPGVVAATNSAFSAEQTLTTTPTSRRCVLHNNHYQQSAQSTSLQITTTPAYGVRAQRRTQYQSSLPPSDTIVNMSSPSAAADERAARIAAIEEEIRRYEPRPANEGPHRFFPEARLTTDRRVLEAENDRAFVRRQRRLALALLAVGVLFYPLGGFYLVRSLAENGPAARNAMLTLSLWFGGSPIITVNQADSELAAWAELAVLFVVGAAWVVVVGVLVAWLRGAL
jgi:hypothetical protein